jgi:Tol biopolymer transport system component
VNPVWSPDGVRIAYVVNGDKGSGLAVRSSGGSGAEEVVLPPNGRVRHLNDWSRDGGLLLYAEENEKRKSDLWVVPVGGGRKPEVVLNSEFNETQGQFSPDGKWIAYVSDETGQPRVYIQPFPPGTGTGGKIAVAGDSSRMPRWRRDGKELFYLALGVAGAVTAVDFASGAAAIPRQLFQLAAFTSDWRQFTWDVSPLGDRFLLNAVPRTQGSAPLTVVLNWQQMLEEEQ